MLRGQAELGRPIGQEVAQIVNDGEPKPIGYVAHRTILPIDRVPDGVQNDISALWIGPGFHLVHYPLRHDALFNIVAVFRTVPEARLEGLLNS